MTPICYCQQPDVVRGERDPQGREKAPYCRRCGYYWAPKYGSLPEHTPTPGAPIDAR